MKEPENWREGRVIRAGSDRFQVALEDTELPCRLRGRIKKERTRRVRNVVVGDRVRVALTGPTENPMAEGVIEEVLTRSSLLSRASAGGGFREQILMANLDRVFLVMAVAEPEFQPLLLDRFLVACEFRDLEAFVCLNKTDLAGPERIESLGAPYRRAGYPVLPVSALSGEGLDSLREAMAGRLSLFLGPSGTGKSTLLQHLQPGLEIATQTVSRGSGQGRHTTSNTQLHPLDFGGFVADSPGVREFELWGMEPRDLAACFPEFEKEEPVCRFPDCSHSHEPDCGLREAVEAGRIDLGRFENYQRILGSLRDKSS